MKIGVIDYGVGNLGSVLRSIEEVGGSPHLIANPLQLNEMDRFILPGVGNYFDCAKLLLDGGWIQAIHEEVIAKEKPLLGICLGMQLLASSSSEGAAKDDPRPLGLNIIPGHVESLRTLGCRERIPHIGWNDVKVKVRSESKGLFEGIVDGTDFYFVHSYAFVPENLDMVVATTAYDIEIAAAVRYKHVWGTQFHPEKSSRAGSRLLKNFINQAVC